MKTVLGIVAEYDPFHNGHAFHLASSISAVCPDFTCVILSGYYKQRGEMALLSPYSRAACALYAGADAVFMLPALWTLRSAENYALGAVSALISLGCTHIAFGAENNDLSVLQKVAMLLECPSPAFQNKLHSELSSGNAYPASVHAALCSVMPAASSVLSSSNNILAVCYLRAIIRLNSDLIPVLIPRMGSYHADSVCTESPSASAIRSALLRGNWNNALNAVPEFTRTQLKEIFLSGQYPDVKAENSVMIHALRMMSKDKARCLPDISEGLENKLLSSAMQFRTREDILSACVSRRIPASRISRILAWAAIDGEYDEDLWNRLPDRLQLLALRKDKPVNGMWKTDSSFVCSSLQELGNSISAEYDKKAARIWAQCSGLPDDFFFRSRVFTL